MQRFPDRLPIAILLAGWLLSGSAAWCEESGQRLEGVISAEGFTRIRIALPDASADPRAAAAQLREGIGSQAECVKHI